jgi:hypothetical protein
MPLIRCPLPQTLARFERLRPSAIALLPSEVGYQYRNEFRPSQVFGGTRSATYACPTSCNDSGTIGCNRSIRASTAFCAINGPRGGVGLVTHLFEL